MAVLLDGHLAVLGYSSLAVEDHYHTSGRDGQSHNEKGHEPNCLGHGMLPCAMSFWIREEHNRSVRPCCGH